MEIHFNIELPVVPMVGDPINFGDKSRAVVGEYARLHIGQTRFIVDADDDHAYEVDVEVAGNGKRGSQRWKAIRQVPRAEFASLDRLPVL